MERWERIERVALLAASGGLAALSLWLLISETGVRLLLALAPLPFAFWAFWQALYEDKLESSDPPTRGERVAYYLWLALRRTTVGAAAAFASCAAVALAYSAVSIGQFIAAAVIALLAVLAGWVAFFGGGIARTLADDARVYKQRRSRYRGNPASEA